MKLTVQLIRHGATKANREGRFLGWTDAPVSRSGMEELKALYPEPIPTDAVFSSPLVRCLDTARLVFGEKKPIVIEEYKEMNFGDFEMKNHHELDGIPSYQEWIDSNGTLPFPNGEDREGFTRRTMIGFYDMLRQCQRNQWSCVGAAVHGGTLMAVLSSVLGQDYFNFLTKNGHGFRLEFSWEEERIERLRYQAI